MASEIEIRAIKNAAHLLITDNFKDYQQRNAMMAVLVEITSESQTDAAIELRRQHDFISRVRNESKLKQEQEFVGDINKITFETSLDFDPPPEDPPPDEGKEE